MKLSSEGGSRVAIIMNGSPLFTGPAESCSDPSRYLAVYLNAPLVRQRLVAVSETTTMTTVAQEGLDTLDVAVPPLTEQAAILVWLDARMERIHGLIRKTQDAINKVRE